MPGPTRLFLVSQLARQGGAGPPRPADPVSDDPALDLARMPESAEVQEARELRGKLFRTVDSIMDGLAVDEELAAEIRRRLGEAAASGQAFAEIRPFLGELRKRDVALANEVGIRFAHHIAGRGLSKALQPPPGFQPVPNSAVGGYCKQVGAKRVYWYPGSGVQHAPQGDAAAAFDPAAQPPAPGQPQPPGAPAPPQKGAAQPPQAPPAKGAPGAEQAAVPGAIPEDEAKPAKLDVSTLLGGNDPDSFNDLSKTERAAATADWDVTKTELDQYAPTQPYKVESAADIRGAAASHIRDLVVAGVFPPGETHRVASLINDTVSLGKEIGADPVSLGQFVQMNVQKLALQEAKAGERTIGDHGIRHIHVNVEQGKLIQAALASGGQKISALDKLMLTQIMIDHDLGYTIPAIHEGGVKVKDNFHPQASRVLWSAQADMSGIFGTANANKMGEIIENHSGTDLDWKDDPLGAVVRLADNTHLFADKMPDLLFNQPKGAELMAKIALAKGAFGVQLGKKGTSAAGKSAGLQEVIGALKDALKEHIDGRADIQPSYRARLLKAADEIGASTEVYLASRLAGRSPTFAFSGGTMRVRIEHSDARKAIGEVFGPDEQDKQFKKMLDDFGISQAAQDKMAAPPPALSVDVPPNGDKKPQASFTWTPSKHKAPEEKALADQLGKLQGQFDGIMRSKSPEARQSRLMAWAGELKKSLLALVPERLAKAGPPPGPGWQTIPGGTKGGWRKPDGKGGWEYDYSDRGGVGGDQGNGDLALRSEQNGLDSARFLAWFGDWRKRAAAVASKVVDPKTGRPAPVAPDPKLSKVARPDGKPMVVFHGSKVEFRAFDPGKVRESGEAGPGFYFSTDPGYAAIFHAEAGKAFKVYLNIRKPFDEEYGGLSGEQLAKSLPDCPFRDKARKDPKKYWGYKDMLGDVFDSFDALRGDSGKSAWRIVRDQLEAAGFDGIRRPEQGHWVAFRPEQIKAVDNEGGFDPGNVDIYKSLGLGR